MPVFLAAVLVRPTRLRWPVAALVVVAAGAVSLRAGPGPIRAVLAMSMFVLLGAAVAAVVYIHIRENERRMSIAHARENERLELARELHDIVGHHVTGIVVLAQASRFTGGAEPGSPADRALADIETAGVETLTSVRRLIGLLRTDPTTSAPPRVADIERIVEDLRTTHPCTQLIIDDAVRAAPVPAELAKTIQRLTQEAATNVRRHGDPTGPVTFSMSSTLGAFELTVENRMLHAPARHRLRPRGHARARRRAGRQLPRRARRRDVADPRRDPDDRARAVNLTQSEPPITVLLADDQAMVRAGFRMIVDSQPDMTVIGEVDNGRAAVELAERIRPDVCLLDIRMPVLDGLAATRLLAGPDVPHPLRVVIATTFDSDEHVQIALRNGAAGFILKDSGPHLLLEAVRAAAAGDALISPSITVRYLDRFIRPATTPSPRDHPLSERELDVARAVARGLGNQEIATELFISLSTVKTHLTSIQTKLRLRNRVQIAIWVTEHDPRRGQGRLASDGASPGSGSYRLILNRLDGRPTMTARPMSACPALPHRGRHDTEPLGRDATRSTNAPRTRAGCDGRDRRRSGVQRIRQRDERHGRRVSHDDRRRQRHRRAPGRCIRLRGLRHPGVHDAGHHER